MPSLLLDNLPAGWTLNPQSRFHGDHPEAVIVDIDGVLADTATTADEYAERKATGNFADHSEIMLDLLANASPYPSIVGMLELLRSELYIILVTARAQAMTDITVAWLSKHNVRWDLLTTHAKLGQAVPHYKTATASELADRGFKIHFAMDDDPENVGAYRAAGMPCLYVHSGWFSTKLVQYVLAERSDNPKQDTSACATGELPELDPVETTLTHGTWRANPKQVCPGDPGKAVVVDIDGVLADAHHRQRYLTDPDFHDWHRFFQESYLDPPFLSVMTLLEMFSDDLRIVMLSSRPAYVMSITTAWLDKHNLRWDLTIIRSEADDDLSPAEHKLLQLRMLEELGCQIKLVIDDEPEVIRAYQEADIPCHYSHSGYYASQQSVSNYSES